MRLLSRAVTYALAALGLLYLTVTLTPVDIWWARWLAGPWNDPTGEVLIVLGGSRLDNVLIGESSYWRSVYTVRTFHEGKFQRVIFSGGAGTPSVAAMMRDFTSCYGLPGSLLRVEERSESTRENALFTARDLAGVPGRKVLLTSDYHMRRAHAAFAKAGLDVLPHPFPDAIKRAQGWPGRWPVFLELITETVKLVYYTWKGWI